MWCQRYFVKLWVKDVDDMKHDEKQLILSLSEGVRGIKLIIIKQYWLNCEKRQKKFDIKIYIMTFITTNVRVLPDNII